MDAMIFTKPVTDSFRVDVMQCPIDPQDGYLFFVINKHRFGTKKISYDVHHAFTRILDAIKEIEIVGQTLWNLSKDELISLWNNSYGDDDGIGALLCNNHTLYPGAYTFDGCLALFLKTEENVRLILEDNGVCEEVRMESNLFFKLLEDTYKGLSRT